ncbi:MAG: hypothetical protein GXO79_00810, partial [Chlorobi bacterium]|nr:hypothetical protein [Chlorobiota bacterium]
MKPNCFKILLSFILLLIITVDTKAQLEEEFKTCDKYLGTQFISDGQQYQAFINNSESAEFNVL